MKRVLAFFLGLAVMFGMVTIPSFAATPGNVTITNAAITTWKQEVLSNKSVIASDVALKAFNIDTGTFAQDGTIDDFLYDKNTTIINGAAFNAEYTASGKQLLGSFAIDKSADVYIGIWCDRLASGHTERYTIDWLEEEGYLPAYNAAGKRLMMYNDNGDGYYLYKKSFIVKENTPATVNFYSINEGDISAKYKRVAPILIDWQDNADVTISKTGEGEIKLNGSVATGAITVFKGTESTFLVTPASKSYIKSITYGSEDFSSVLPAFEAKNIKIKAVDAESELKVEFSNEYDFSGFDVTSEKYTDTQTSNIKQRIVLKGTTNEFLKGKILKAEITDSNLVTQTIEGVIGNDGAYELKEDLTLNGDVAISLNLYFDTTLFEKVAETTYTIESLDKINAFINNLRDIENYTDEKYVKDLTDDGTYFGFDTEIFLLMNEMNQTALIQKMKENFTFESIEKTVELYNSYIPYYALSNTENSDLIIATLKKYEDFYTITNEKIYKRYDAMTDKNSVVSSLFDKNYNNNTAIKDDLFKSVIMKEFYDTSLHTDIGDIIDNIDNRVYVTPSNISTYDGFSQLAYKNDVLTKVMELKPSITTFDILISTIENAITEVAQSIIILPPPGGNGGFGGGGGGGNVTSSIEIKGELEEKPVEEKSAFKDVPQNFWAFNAVNYLVKAKVIETDNENFYPDKNTTRGEFVKYIVRAYNIETPTEAEEISFNDVSKDSELYLYILSAKNAGIINGISENEFGINNSITRQDAAVIMLRVLEYANQLNFNSSDEEVSFTDKNDISEYASDAVAVLSQCNILNGSDNRFLPLNSITNAEVSQFVYNALTNDSVLKSYYETLNSKEYVYEEIAGSSGEDYGYNQGGMTPVYTEAPSPHPVPGVININYNNKYLYMENYPVIVDGRTLAPVRSLFGVFGAKIQWNSETGEATIIKDDVTIILKPDSINAYVNGEEYILDVPAKTIDGRIYVPLRFIAERLQLSVEWIEEEMTVYLK